MPFIFNAVEFCVVTINEKPWVRAREVCRALEYQKGRVRDVLKKHVNIENKQHKHELEERAGAAFPLDWPKNSQPGEYYISEEGMYESVFRSVDRMHCCNVMFQQIRQQLTKKKMKEEHQQVIEEKDIQRQAIQYENVALQAQRGVYQTQLQKCQDTITHLRTRYVDHVTEPGKDNIIIIL